MRDVNISYNTLNFAHEESTEYLDSMAVLENLDELFSNGIILNHFNMSGMNFTMDKIKLLCESIIKNDMLMSIHMNDNGITLDYELMLEILDMFGIQEKDLPPDRLSGGNQS